MSKRTIAGWVTLVLLLLGLMALTFVDFSSAHEVNREPTAATPDSVSVMFETDIDNDGVWEIRHLFVDKADVWDKASNGWMRVTVTTGNTTDTDYGYFFRDMIADTDSIGMVDLGLFSGFGQAYGDSCRISATGVKSFETSHAIWYVYPKPETQ